MKITIGFKLNALCSALVVLPLLAIGGFSLYALLDFSQDVTSMANERLTADAERQLIAGARAARDEVTGFVNMAKGDTLRLATSSTLSAYLMAQRGENETWKQATRNHSETVMKGILEAVRVRNSASEQTLRVALALGNTLMQGYGPFTQTRKTVSWNAINQFSQETQTLTLPEVRLGDTPIPQNREPVVPTPLVDAILSRIGGAATLFQRMNEEGDMLRIATSVLDNEGKRAIGTYIPALQPDGTPNAVIATLLKGETFTGRAFVVNEWYLTAYQPIWDMTGRLSGALFTGLPEKELNATLAQSITTIRLGRTGYPFVMDSKSTLLVHPRSEWVGKNVINDLKVRDFQEVLDKRRQDEVGWLTYRHPDGRLKYISYGYFEPWDWVVCASGYLDEMSESAAKESLSLLQEDMLNMARLTVVHTPGGEKPPYSQIRLLDPQGMELIAVQDGKLLHDFKSEADVLWFEEAKKLPEGQVHIAPVSLSRTSGRSVLRVAAPVYREQSLHGVVVINTDWELAWDLLSDNAFAQSGYAFILDSEGFVLAHPEYSPQDAVNLTDPKFTALANLVKSRILKGEEGAAPYTDGQKNAYMGFTPLVLGDSHYAVATQAPRSEVFEIAMGIENIAHKDVRMITRVLGFTLLTLTLLGVGLGILFSRSLVSPIKSCVVFTGLMAKGDFSQDVPETFQKRSDEIGDLARAFHTMVHSIRQLLRHMGEGVTTVANSATELSGVSTDTARSVQSLSEKTASTARAAEESSSSTSSVAVSMEQATTNLNSVASATEEMTATIAEIASSSEKARGISSDASQQASSISTLMQQLGAAAQEIGQVTEAISDISSQTNLLALNATIEAARAGESGKGFTVVATEIKELARQTASATENIKAKIDGVQDSVRNAIRDTGKITGVVEEMGQIIASIAAAIEEQAAVTRDVAGNIAQASAGIQEANARVSQTASVSRTMAKDIAAVNTSAEDIRSGGDAVRLQAGDLSRLAAELKGRVGQFKTA